MTDVYYSINGVDIGEASSNSMGWVLLRNGTNPLGGVTRELNKVVVPGYDGYFTAPGRSTEQTIILNIKTPRENLDALLAVLSHTGYHTSFPNLGVLSVNVASGKAAYFELASALPASNDSSDGRVTVTATLNIPYGGFRDTSTTETNTSVTVNPQTFTLASGSSLPIRDADIFIQGDVGTFQITDSKGSWLRTTSNYVYASGFGILYQGVTGRAFKAANGSPYVPVSDLGFAVDVSGGGFQMTPKFTPTTPNTRYAELKVLSTNLSGITVKVRWRGAYTVR